MRRDHREPLDQAIDRVLESMVSGPAAAGAADWMPPALYGVPRWSWRRPVALAASFAVITVLTALLWNGSPAIDESAAPEALSSRPLVTGWFAVPPSAVPAPIDRSGDLPVRVATAPRGLPGTPGAAPVGVAVESAGGPVPLVVEGLELSPLETPALTLAALGIDEIRMPPLVAGVR